MEETVFKVVLSIFGIVVLITYIINPGGRSTPNQATTSSSPKESKPSKTASVISKVKNRESSKPEPQSSTTSKPEPEKKEAKAETESVSDEVQARREAMAARRAELEAKRNGGK